MRNFKRFVCGLAVLMIILTACQPGRKVIRIGAVYDLTGKRSSQDFAAAQGAKLAVKEINKQGGINGKSLELIIIDGKSDSTVANVAVRDLIKKRKVRLVMGLTDPASAGSALRTSEQSQTPLLIPYFPGTATPRLIWQTGFTSQAQTDALAEYAWDYAELRSCVILTDTSTEANTALAQQFRAAYDQKGGWILKEIPFSELGYNSAFIAQSINNDRVQPAMIFLAAKSDVAAEAVSGLRKAGITIPILGDSSFDTEAMRTITVADSSRVICPSHAYLEADATGAAQQEFIHSFQAEYPAAKISALAGLEYDTVYFIASALRKCRDKKPESLAHALSQTILSSGVAGRLAYRPDVRYPVKQVCLISIVDGRKKELAMIAPLKP